MTRPMLFLGLVLLIVQQSFAQSDQLPVASDDDILLATDLVSKAKWKDVDSAPKPIKNVVSKLREDLDIITKRILKKGLVLISRKESWSIKLSDNKKGWMLVYRNETKLNDVQTSTIWVATAYYVTLWNVFPDRETVIMRRVDLKYPLGNSTTNWRYVYNPKPTKKGK